MGKRQASVDQMVHGFDDAIGAWVDKNIDAIAETYGVEKVELLGDLGDRIYQEIELDPNHLKRFIGFYVNDNKMQELVDDVMSELPRAASVSPAEVSASLRAVAAFLSAGSAPSRSDVVSRLSSVLDGLGHPSRR